MSFGDAEVEQLQRAVARDQDVRRLEIAMDDQVLVGRMHGGTHAAEERQPFLERQAMPVAVQVDAFAVHVLHDEIRDAVAGRAAIEQAADVAMVEARQDLALGAQPVVIRAAHEAGPHQFHGNLMAVFADALGEIHVAHAAAAEPATQLPGAEHLAGAVYFPEGLFVRRPARRRGCHG